MICILSEASKLDLSLQRWMFSTTVATLLVMVAKWWNDSHITKKLERKTERATQQLERKTEETKQEIKRDIQENTELSKSAFNEANALNQKILACQLTAAGAQLAVEEVVEQVKKNTEALTIVFQRLDGKRERIHQIANDVNSIKLALAVPEAPPIAGEKAKPNEQ